MVQTIRRLNVLRVNLVEIAQEDEEIEFWVIIVQRPPFLMDKNHCFRGSGNDGECHPHFAPVSFERLGLEAWSTICPVGRCR